MKAERIMPGSILSRGSPPGGLLRHRSRVRRHANARLGRHQSCAVPASSLPAAGNACLATSVSTTSFASAVKSGYRNVSPLFNGLESAGNLINGGLLRPVYIDSTIVLPDGTR